MSEMDVRELDIAGIPAEKPSPEAPAFKVWPAWNAAGCAGISALAFLIFVLAQLAVFFWLIGQIYPGAFHRGLSPNAMAAVARDLQTLSGLSRILSAQNLWLMSIVSDGALIVAAAGLARLAFGASWASLGIGVRPRANQIGYGFAVGGVLLVASIIVGLIEAAVFGPHPQIIAEVLKQRHGAGSFLLDLMSVSIAAPIGEEFFFRGLIFTALVQRMPVLWAAIISGAIFGAAHGDAWNFPSLFLIGIGLGYLYYRSKSLWPNIAAHATVNGVTLALAYIAPQLVK